MSPGAVKWLTQREVGPCQDLRADLASRCRRLPQLFGARRRCRPTRAIDIDVRDLDKIKADDRFSSPGVNSSTRLIARSAARADFAIGLELFDRASLC